MGDPALRLHPFAPPFALLALTNASGGTDLSWNAASNQVLGYHVYRAPLPSGPYSRLTTSLVAGNGYTDAAESSERFYMVRAVRLENSSSGSYYNPSQGAFAELPLGPASGDNNQWAGKGGEIWTMSDARGIPGEHPGWDWRKIDGTLDITATPASQFTVRVISVSTNGLAAPPANFDRDSGYAWPILTASTSISGFDRTKISLVTDEFQADLGGGLFDLSLSEDARLIELSFAPNHSPIAQPALFNRAWDTPLEIGVDDFLATYTSDPDGDARALIQIGSSTNGTSIFTDGTRVVFSSTNNLPETVSYWVQDLRNYRPGDTVRTAAGTITIQPLPEGADFSAHHAIEIEWPTEAGQRYQVQFRLEAGAAWINKGEPYVGTGDKISLFERAAETNRFYRVILIR